MPILLKVSFDYNGKKPLPNPLNNLKKPLIKTEFKHNYLLLFWGEKSIWFPLDFLDPILFYQLFVFKHFITYLFDQSSAPKHILSLKCLLLSIWDILISFITYLIAHHLMG